MAITVLHLGWNRQIFDGQQILQFCVLCQTCVLCLQGINLTVLGWRWRWWRRVKCSATMTCILLSPKTTRGSCLERTAVRPPRWRGTVSDSRHTAGYPRWMTAVTRRDIISKVTWHGEWQLSHGEISKVSENCLPERYHIQGNVAWWVTAVARRDIQGEWKLSPGEISYPR